MAATYNSYTANGTTSTFAVTFPQYEYTSLLVTVNGIETTGYTYNAQNSQLTINTPVLVAGDAIIIRRITDLDILYKFAQNAGFTGAHIDADIQQAFHAVEEARDYSGLIGYSLGDNLNARNHKIYNLANGTAPQDAINYRQLMGEADQRVAGDLASRKFAADLFNSATHYLPSTNNYIYFAESFGVKNDGTPCGAQCVLAIEFIMANGGTLIWPVGEINWGTTRAAFRTVGGPAFALIGAGGQGTLWTFDNVDPVSSTGSWAFTEGQLLLFGVTPNATTTTYMGQMTMENITIDYSRQANKGGPTYATMGVGAHPTPYSDGCLALNIVGADRPKIRNVTIQNVYGSGIRLWKCTDAEVESCALFDVSANQPLTPAGGEAGDHFGYGVWAGACINTTMKDVVVWNTRVYQCDPALVSPTNGAAYNGTLCGYIGLYGEYAQNYSSPNNNVYGPRGKVLWDNTSDFFNYVKITDCTVYGYVLGLKSEANVHAFFDRNRVINCIIPISVQSSANVTQNYVHMGNAGKYRSPQNGFELQRACIVFSWFANSVHQHKQVCSHNVIIAPTYRGVQIGKSNLIFTHNYVEASGTARWVDTATNYDIDLVTLTHNFFRLRSDAVSNGTGNVRITNCQKLVFSNNMVLNESATTRPRIQIYSGCLSTKLEENLFRGGVFIYASQFDVSIVRNKFDNPDSDVPISIEFQNSARNCKVIDNEFILRASQRSAQLIFLVSVDTAEISGNRITAINDVAVTSPYPICRTFGVCRNIKMEGNFVTGDASAGANGISLMAGSSGLHLFTCDRNATDGSTQMMSLFSIGAPWVIGNNAWPMTWASNVNQPNNVSSGYIPTYGDRMYTTRPTAGGGEGYVYCIDDTWHAFGTITA